MLVLYLQHPHRCALHHKEVSRGLERSFIDPMDVLMTPEQGYSVLLHFVVRAVGRLGVVQQLLSNTAMKTDEVYRCHGC